MKSEKTEKDPFGGHEWQTVFDSRTAAEDGSFRTERIAPRRYLLVGEAYTPLTREQRLRTGIIAPALSSERRSNRGGAVALATLSGPWRLKISLGA